ncbi:MAG: Plug domain-containing protein [Opitutus sp.]|nr:Plug domain-containing protein [Opitutus sp.]
MLAGCRRREPVAVAAAASGDALAAAVSNDSLPMSATKYGASGVTQNQAFNEDVNIRGFRSGATLRDGAARSTTKFAPMYDVERIEILKGPGAMLRASMRASAAPLITSHGPRAASARASWKSR